MKLNKEEKYYLINAIDYHIKNINKTKDYCKAGYKTNKDRSYWKMNRELSLRIKWLNQLKEKIK